MTRLAVVTWIGCAGVRPAAERAELFSCSHPFQPMGPMVRREYRVTSADPAVGVFRYTQSYVAEGGGEPTFAETLAFSNGVRRVAHLRCEDGGGWRQLATEVAGASAAPSARLDSTGKAGLPSADQWRIGRSWTETGELSGADLPTGSGALPATGVATVSGTVTVTSTIAAQESVEVPAGRFDAFRVDATSTQRVTVRAAALGSFPIELVYTTRSWYARDVGLVRQTTEPYGLVTELLAVRPSL